MESEKKIKILHCGPYEVSSDIPLGQDLIVADGTGNSEEWKKGRSYANPKPGKDYHLCRCGHSRNKPFCDGTHSDVNFAGTETDNHEPYLDEASVYEGEQIDLLDNEKFCAVARYCDATPTTWDSAIHSAEVENRKIAIEKACKCPSGRLTAMEKDGTPIEPKLDREIGVVEDVPSDCRGPLWVKGGIVIEGVDGRVYEPRNRVTLCRCGESANKPFCDARHLRAAHMRGLDK